MISESAKKLDRPIVAGLMLGSILVLAAALRIYGIEWGLPDATHPEYSYHPDEALTIVWARALADPVGGYIFPKQFIYGGTLHYTILNGCAYFGEVLSPVLGGFNHLANTILIGRYFLVVISLLTILLLYLAGRHLFGNTTGLIAALLLAVNPIHIVGAQRLRPDETATLFVVLLAFLGAVIYRSDPKKDRLLFLLAGCGVGLAVALRFPLAVFGLVPVVAYVWRDGSPYGSNSIAKLLVDSNIWIMVACAFVMFVLASPHTVLYPDAAIAGLRMTWGYETLAYPDAVDRGSGLYQYGWRMLREALGAPMYWLAASGMAFALYQHAGPQRIVLVGVVPYFILATFASWVVVRYMLPVVPLLLLLAAAFVVYVTRIASRLRHVMTLLLCVAILWTLAASLALLGVTANRNSRDITADWIRANVPIGASIVTVRRYLDDVQGDVYLNPIVPEGYRHQPFYLLPKSDPRAMIDSRPDYIVLNDELYLNMERLGSRHPSQITYSFYRALAGSRYRLVHETKQPVTFFGMNFEGSFSSSDFSVVNPGLRIYRYVH